MKTKRLFWVALALLGCSGCGSDTVNDNNALTESITTSEFAKGLNQPAGLAIDPNAEVALRDHLFVAQFGDGTILKITPDGLTSEKVAEGLNGPSSLLPVANKGLLVAQLQANHVAKIDYAATPATKQIEIQFPEGVFAVELISAGPFRYAATRNINSVGKNSIYNISTNTPTEIAGGFASLNALTFRVLDQKLQFLAGDAKTNRLYVLEVPDNIPKSPRQGGYDTLTDKVTAPSAIAVGPASQRIYVAESSRGQITRFESNGGKPKLIAQIASPAGLAFDSQGNLFVSSLSDGIIYKVSGLNEGFQP